MNLGMPEMIFIFLLALVLFGPKKLPELGRQIGKFMAEFKKASNEFKSQLETEMLNIELEETAKKNPVAAVGTTVVADEGRTILPAEKLFDTISVPPMSSIPRTALPSPPPSAALEPAVEPTILPPAEPSPANPAVPSHDA